MIQQSSHFSLSVWESILYFEQADSNQKAGLLHIAIFSFIVTPEEIFLAQRKLTAELCNSIIQHFISNSGGRTNSFYVFCHHH